jgi:hypothetical protein
VWELSEKVWNLAVKAWEITEDVGKPTEKVWGILAPYKDRARLININIISTWGHTQVCPQVEKCEVLGIH